MLNKNIKNRRSIRSYKPNTPLCDEQIKELLEAAMLAPSACNSRPWSFIVVRNRQKLDRLIELHSYGNMLKTASVAIIVCADATLTGIPTGFFPQDCAAATQNILLQAAELGLGTCWCGVYPKENLMASFTKEFDLPKGIVPFNLIAVGVPDENWGSRGFYEEEKVTWL